MSKNNIYLIITLVGLILVSLLMSRKTSTESETANPSAFPSNGLVTIQHTPDGQAAKQAPRGAAPAAADNAPAAPSDQLVIPAAPAPADRNAPAAAPAAQ